MLELSCVFATSRELKHTRLSGLSMTCPPHLDSARPAQTLCQNKLVASQKTAPDSKGQPGLVLAADEQLDPTSVVAADFTVTQVVDGRQGVHVHIPRTIFPPK